MAKKTTTKEFVRILLEVGSVTAVWKRFCIVCITVFDSVICNVDQNKNVVSLTSSVVFVISL